MSKRKWNNGCSLFTDSAFSMNQLTMVDYLKRLEEIAINMFEWKNLPYDIDERFLELTLFTQGYAVFFYEEVMERYLALQAMIGGNLDVYRVPRRRRAYAVNGYNKELTDRDSVLIFNNYLREPSFPTVQLYAQRLYAIERAIDVNVNAQKTPVMILCDESQRLTMRNLYSQYDGNEPFIFGSKALDIQGVTTLNTGAPYIADKLMVLKHQYWNEVLTFLGVENANTDKRERLITDEVQSNLGAVQAQRYVRLNMRRKACDQINRMFGLNVSVDFRSDIQTTLPDGRLTDVSRETTENVSRETMGVNQ